MKRTYGAKEKSAGKEGLDCAFWFPNIPDRFTEEQEFEISKAKNLARQKLEEAVYSSPSGSKYCIGLLSRNNMLREIAEARDKLVEKLGSKKDYCQEAQKLSMLIQTVGLRDQILLRAFNYLIENQKQAESAFVNKAIVSHHLYLDYRNQLIKRTIPLALHLAHSSKARLDLEDKIGAAMQGLIKAGELYNPDNEERSFGVFAGYVAKTYIAKEMYKSSRTIRIPIGKYYRLRNLDQAKTILNSSEGNPSPERLARFMKKPVKKIMELEAITRPIEFTDRILNSIEEKDSEEENRGYRHLENLGEALAILTEREQTVLKSKFYSKTEQIELAKEWKMTKQNVSHIKKKAMFKLREHFEMLDDALEMSA